MKVGDTSRIVITQLGIILTSFTLDIYNEDVQLKSMVEINASNYFKKEEDAG